MALTQNKKISFIIIAVFLGSLFVLSYLGNPRSPIIEYTPYITGSISLLVGIYLYLFYSGLYKPKYKTVAQVVLIENMARTNVKQRKFMAIFLMLFGAYNLIWHDPDMYRLKSDIEANKWTAKDKARLLQIYANGISSRHKEHPELVKIFCNCIVNSIMKSIGRQEYINDLKLPGDEQDKIFSPLVTGCAPVYQRGIDSLGKQRK